MENINQYFNNEDDSDEKEEEVKQNLIMKLKNWIKSKITTAPNNQKGIPDKDDSR